MEKARIYWPTAQVCYFIFLLFCLLWLFFLLLFKGMCSAYTVMSFFTSVLKEFEFFCILGFVSLKWVQSGRHRRQSQKSCWTLFLVPSVCLRCIYLICPYTWLMYHWATDTESNAEFHTAWTGKKAKANFFKDCTWKETIFWVYMREKKTEEETSNFWRECSFLFCALKRKKLTKTSLR